jgi:hypothetical protein
MILLLSLSTILILFLSIWMVIEWFVHIEMTKDNSEYYGWANYDRFISEFNKYQWDNEKWYGYSLWDRNNDCKIHASIIYFENKGMIMKTPLDWLLVNLHIRKYFKVNIIGFKNKKLIKW